ncbi:hypothetical protein V2154_13340 [Ewingella sp. CoE-038-23]|uniref:hypothetical protein n=1 Tax=Ewingella docleensis TaxID=3118588 RepID=UPI0033655DD1
MKELKEFTVERLELMIEHDHAQTGDVAALAKIALAAKQAQIVAWEVKGIFCHTKEEASIYVGDPEPLYDAPPLNHTEQHMEAPDGWKLVPIEPTVEMREAFHESYEDFENCVGECPDSQWKAMLRAAPKPEM